MSQNKRIEVRGLNYAGSG